MLESPRGKRGCVAMVTTRFRPFTIGGPGAAPGGLTVLLRLALPHRCGDSANLLTPPVGDANTMTPGIQSLHGQRDQGVGRSETMSKGKSILGRYLQMHGLPRLPGCLQTVERIARDQDRTARATYQNPQDVSAQTWKLVRFPRRI